jgi:hypothetical protein
MRNGRLERGRHLGVPAPNLDRNYFFMLNVALTGAVVALLTVTV